MTASQQQGTIPAGGEPAAAPAAPPAARLTGGAAILAKMRAQKAARAATDAAAAASAPRGVVILHASQLGTATEIAKNIHAEAESRGIKSRLASMNDFGFDALRPENAPVVIFVASSTGDGDAPDNSAKFYAAVKRRSNPEGMLKGISFTCLGLGDSNYTRFMAVSRALRTRFLELGAETFYPPGEADEVDGLEEVVDKWLEGLWPALAAATQPTSGGTKEGAGAVSDIASAPSQNIMALPPVEIKLQWLEGAAAVAVREQEVAAAATGGPTALELAHRDVAGGGLYTPEAPFWAPLVEARTLTTAAAGDREVLHVGLDISGSGMSYSPGDSIGVMPQNSPALVDAIITRLGVEPDAVFEVMPIDGVNGAEQGGNSTHLGSNNKVVPLHHLHWPCTIRSALLRGCDLTSPPRKSLLRTLAEHCSDVGDKERLLHLCSRDGRDAYAKDILQAQPTLLDLLEMFSSCQPPLDALLDALPPLPARMYSLTCAKSECPDTVQVAFTVVRYQAGGTERQGVATSWLKRICSPVLDCGGGGGGRSEPTKPLDAVRVPIFLRHGGDFKPPADLAAPWILIGPGTGVAPFRGFLQDRRHRVADAPTSSVGPCWLFFGCRHPEHDFIYEEDLRKFESDGTLTKFHVAFSRAQEKKVYVQHIMAKFGRELHDMIMEQGGYVFVCGDGAGMAKDVHQALIDMCCNHGDASPAEAAGALTMLAKEGRYVRDVWS